MKVGNFSIVFVVILVSVSGSVSSGVFVKHLPLRTTNENVNVTVMLTVIRDLCPRYDIIPPSFYVKIFLNNEEIMSPVWIQTYYVYTQWSTTRSVSASIENVPIRLQLWDGDHLCDIQGTHPGQRDINLTYNLTTGYWQGDDYHGDESGYGRLNGVGDEENNQSEYRECELWFSITQTDVDGDGIPPWMELNVYHTDPEVDDSTYDPNGDGIPITWEWWWGLDPYSSENQSSLDPDNDSLTNFEEYLVRGFQADPFRRDVFLELDFMEETPDGDPSVIPQEAGEMLKNPFHKKNIVFHVDTGQLNGGELFPFDESVNFDEAREIYNNYFLHDNVQEWKRGISHYGIIVYDCTPKGYAFSADVEPYSGYLPGTNCFMISSKRMERNAKLSSMKSLPYFYGSAIMHEMGHHFSMRWGNPPGVDVQRSKFPWQLGYWWYQNYQSIMNYRYTYKIFDYSDGTHGKRDNNDWAQVNLSFFEIPDLAGLS